MKKSDKKVALVCKSRFLVILLIFFTLICISSYAQEKYSIQPDSIARRVKFGDFVEVPVRISNNDNTVVSLTFGLEGSVRSIISLDKQTLTIDPESTGQVELTIFGQNISTYRGYLVIGRGISERIPINITVTDLSTTPVEALLLEIEPITERAEIGDVFNFKISVQNLLSDQKFNVTMVLTI